jgi:hypothetical protein
VHSDLAPKGHYNWSPGVVRRSVFQLLFATLTCIVTRTFYCSFFILPSNLIKVLILVNFTKIRYKGHRLTFLRRKK